MRAHFEEDKRYHTSTGAIIHITDRTPCYVYYSVEYDPLWHGQRLVPYGKKKIRRGFYGDEFFYITPAIPSAKGGLEIVVNARRHAVLVDTTWIKC